MYRIYPYLDKRSAPDRSGAYPIKIAIGHGQKTDYVNTSKRSKPGEFNPDEEELTQFSDQVRKIVESLTVYDIKLIRSLFKSTPELVTLPKEQFSQDVFIWYEKKIAECLQQRNGICNAEAYRDSKKFYMKHSGLRSAPFTYFTAKVLYEIEQKALSEIRRSTIFKYARHLRAVYNMAILERAVPAEVYPFHKRGYLIGTSTKAKKSLSRSDISKLMDYLPENDREQQILDYFFFSYYANGMNLKDVAYLRNENIIGPTIRFYRFKTAERTIDPEPIIVSIIPELLDIMNRQGKRSSCPTDFIFPIIKEEDPVPLQNKDYRNFGRVINCWLKKIAKKIDIASKITHGISRHSFANALRQEKIPDEYISEALGHSSLSVTKHYLNSFEDIQVQSHAEKLRKYGKG